MNCKDANELLERMIFEEVPEDAGFRQHIGSCPSCGRAYKEALEAREVMNRIRNMEPAPRDPEELTDSIMNAIQKIPPKTTVVPIFLSRLLAAASLGIFLLFGYEQYGVVSKIAALETKFAVTKQYSPYPGPRQMASAYNISRTGISFSELESILSGVKGKTGLSLSSSKNK